MSKSTDKLRIINGMIRDFSTSLPQDKLQKMKSVGIDWVSVPAGDYETVACPKIVIEFFE